MKKLIFSLSALFCFASSSWGMISDDVFFKMVKEGDAEGIRTIISQGQNPDIRNENQETPICLAAKYGCLEIVRILANASSDINARDIDGLAPLHKAFLIPALNGVSRDLIKKKLGVVKFLLAMGADVNAKDNGGRTPLIFFAMLYRDMEERDQEMQSFFEAFIDAQADLNVQDNEGETALNWSAGGKYEAIAKLLIHSGADVNVKNDQEMMALHWATIEGNENVALLLIDSGSDIHVKNKSGATALLYASLRGQANVVAALLKRGVEVNIEAVGLTPLHAATGFGIVILEKETSDRPFQKTVKRLGIPEVNFLKITRVLVEAGADINAPIQATGMTPLDCSLVAGNADVTKYLKSIGAKSGKKWYWPF
jgi:ankyrin repeat protein